MNFEQQINDDLKEAMKSGDKLKLETLRSLRASIIEFSKNGTGKELAEEDAQKILLNAAKKRKDAIEMYQQAGRQDLLEKEQAELAIIASYLPEQLTEEQVLTVLRGLISQLGAEGPKDMGKVMGVAMKELRGKADGTLVQQCLKSLLQG
ncbi:MAG: GatB/YqeY domain-containing protein [Bacteroidetes bacterium]|nr:GatB/YqeY domain-containing protein [bacterium]NBP63841.1 GatB/YqeY domain-containing protein [Bacteroidota bacterium]